MAEQPEKKTCLKCQHENPETATVCEQCGAPLKPTTVPVPDIKKELAEQAQKPVTKKKTDELVKQIALWVRNEPKPVLVDIGRGHVLGRRTSASDPPDLVDLTDYGAYRLGVSRRHAQFECTEDGCIVIDLGSSNGTWVNGLRLEPYQPAHVKSGDRINLGRMEFSIGYALSDAPPAAPPPASRAKTDPHFPAVSPTALSTGKADTTPDAPVPASPEAKPVPSDEKSAAPEAKPAVPEAKPATTEAEPAASAATSTVAISQQPEEGTPAQENAAKEAAEQPAAAPPAAPPPVQDKPKDEAKPPEGDKQPPESNT